MSSLLRADFPLSLHRKHTHQLYTQIVRLLNHLHATSVITRLVKVKAHCGEPLYKAANALESALAEADWAPVTGEWHLDPRPMAHRPPRASRMGPPGP
jgi:hypothetical protein